MVRESVAVTSAGRVRYLEAGAGWPVVLLHGFPLSADMWRPQLERVGDGCRLLAPDLPGFGPDPVMRAPGTTGMDDLAAAVESFMDALELERGTIGGLSMGGYVALALFRKAPQRFERIVLADTRSQADSAEGRAGRAAMLERLAAVGPSAVADDMMPKLLGTTTRRERRAIEPAVRAMIEANRAPGLAAAIEAMRDRPDSTPDLAAIGIPALILAGDEDVITPLADAVAMQARIARSRLVVLPSAGHLSNLETPDAFSQALADFLASNL